MYQAIAFIAPLAGLAAASSVPVDTYEYDQVEFKVINKDIQFRKLDGVCRNAHGGAGSPKVLQVSKDVCEKVCTDDPRCYAYEFRPHDNCELHLEEIESAEFVPHAPHATCNIKLTYARFEGYCHSEEKGHVIQYLKLGRTDCKAKCTEDKNCVGYEYASKPVDLDCELHFGYLNSIAPAKDGSTCDVIEKFNPDFYFPYYPKHD